MSNLTRRSLLTGGAGMLALPKPEPQQTLLFATDEYEIQMTLEYHDHNPRGGLRFQEQSSQRHFCLSFQGEENRNCINDFRGSIAVARYRILPHGGAQSASTLREYVRNIDQSDRVAIRPPFERIIQIQQGLASDIQVFGYQVSSRSSGDDGADSDDAWCLLRQNLYLRERTAPFLIVHWKHTLSSIRALDIIPENGTWQIANGGKSKR